MEKIKTKIINKITKINLIGIALVFYTSVWRGYKEYCRLKKKHGNLPIITPAFKGTGDFYMVAKYFPQWLKFKKIDKYMMIAGGASEIRVLELFPQWFSNAQYEILSWEHYTYLIHMRLFWGVEKSDIYVLNHIANFGGEHTNYLWITWNLMGYKGLSLLDFYLIYGCKLSKLEKPLIPIFETDSNKIDKIFKYKKLKPGKTVMISPYSTGNGTFHVSFWNSIVKQLQLSGYSVCTNCFGSEKPLANTVKLGLDYRDLVPFMDKAGFAIGIRSGFFDIISSSTCKKIIIHTFKANHWPNGNSLPYTGLKHLGLCNDAIEYELNSNESNFDVIRRSILGLFAIHVASSKKTIKIKYVDVPPDFNKEKIWITRVLREKYNVVFSDNPEFLFYSVFGLTFDQYKNCIKIFFTGEDTIPNFNECDYAMCHDRLELGDRYIRADVGERYGTPIGNLEPDWIEKGISISGWINSSLIDIKDKIQNRSIVSEKLINRRFCNFIYSNESFGEGAVLRKKFCLELMKYRRVDCPGRVLNNMKDGLGIRWSVKDGRDSIVDNWTSTKLEFIKNYKFTIAFENTAIPGHTTEKLIHPFYAYSIPIYWGNPDVVADFNPKAFINCNDYNNDWRAVCKRIKELDQDHEQYLEMLRQPPMQPDFDFGSEEKAKQFLYNIVEKGYKPYTKSSLAFTAPNVARNSYHELMEIKTSNSWKVARRIQAFLGTKWGWFPRQLCLALLNVRNRLVKKK